MAPAPKDPCPYGPYESHMRLRNDSLAPEWSPDGRWIAVVRNGEAVIVETGGSRRILLPDVPAPPRGWPGLRLSWAPRGTGLIVQGRTDLYLVRPGRPAKRVARGCFGAWHPDGTRIAWAAEGRVSVSRPDGSRRRVVARGGYVDDWSPDGRSLLIARTTPIPTPCERTRLALLRLATRRVTALTGETVVRNGQTFTRSNQGLGSFSPDGRSIAFPEEVPCSYTGADRLRFAYVWNGKTRAVRLVDRGLPAWAARRNILAVSKGMEFSVTDPAKRQFQFSRGGGFIFGDARPALSPDGRRVAYSVARDYGLTNVKIARIDRPLEARTFADLAWAPSWSPDGRWIAFLGYERCREALIAAPANGGPRRVLLPCL
jgi:hypothetical protein